MTPEESIEILEEVKELDDTLYAYNAAYMEALEVAISTLKEVQQYRAIGTVEECREAVSNIKTQKYYRKVYEVYDFLSQSTAGSRENEEKASFRRHETDWRL